MLTSVKWEEVTDEGLVITTKEGERKTLPADTILLATGFEPNTELFEALEGKFPEIYRVGVLRGSVYRVLPKGR